MGSSACVLFTLSPSYHVYSPTGISKNFVYLNLPMTGQLASEAYLSNKRG